MKNYKTLLFDADDTLLDFGATESYALRLLFEKQQITLAPEMEQQYKELNQSLWKAYEVGELNRDEVVNTRFSTFLKEYGKEVDGRLMEKSYRSYLANGHHLIDGAMALVESLHKHFDLYIVTNGFAETQDRRLRESGLSPYFKDVFVSEDTGYQKPMRGFFDYVFARIPEFDKEQILIIGDSLSSDIKGGNLSGLDTCWFNPKRRPNDTDITPTYEIQKLEELHALLPVSTPR